MSRLNRSAVERVLNQLAEDVSARQMARLRELATRIQPDGRIRLSEALEIATPEGNDVKRQASFRKFRTMLAEAAAQVGIELSLVSDGQKVSPGFRYCWFEGADGTAAQLAEMSERESRRGAVRSPVTQNVAEFYEGPPPFVIHVSTDFGRDNDPRIRRAVELIDYLRERLSVRHDFTFRVTDSLRIPMGLSAASERNELMSKADMVLVLVSANYINGMFGEIDRIANASAPLFVSFESLPPGPLDLRGIDQNNIYLVQSPYADATTRKAKMRFVDDLVERVTDRISHRQEEARSAGDGLSSNASIESFMAASATNRMPTERLVDSLASETDLDSRGGTPRFARDTRHLSASTPAVARLIKWATDAAPESPLLCALLGDAGMGKSTTTKLLTAQLLEMRKSDKTVPLPLLFDLRDLSLAVLRSPSLRMRDVIQAILTSTESLGERPTVDDVAKAINDGNCLMIFDGLDEALVHLSPHEGQRFTRMLWRSTEESWRDVSENGGRPHRSKLLLSCRTQYFRSVQDEAAHFTGQDRDGPRARQYLTLMMMPFDEMQVRDYLRANVSHANTNALMDTLNAVHNLRELAARPLTLRLISDQFVHTKFLGDGTRPFDLYGALVKRWLSRDDGKHTLLPRHKLLLMEELAGQLWRAGQLQWKSDEIDDWLVTFLEERPEMRLHYAERAPDIWKEDLRTATFLTRTNEDTFSFAHSSLREYFLARYFIRVLNSAPSDVSAARDLLTVAVPSRETLDFMGQGISALPQGSQLSLTAALKRFATSYTRKVSELVLAYGIVAAGAGYPHHKLSNTDLHGADLRGWTIRLPSAIDASLSNSTFEGAQLGGATIHGAVLKRANFSSAGLMNATFIGCILEGARFGEAALNGTAFVDCELTDTVFVVSTASMSQAIRCIPAYYPDVEGWKHEPALPGLGGPEVREAIEGSSGRNLRDVDFQYQPFARPTSRKSPRARPS